MQLLELLERLIIGSFFDSSLQRRISFWRASGDGCVSAVMHPMAPAFPTAATRGAYPT